MISRTRVCSLKRVFYYQPKRYFCNNHDNFHGEGAFLQDKPNYKITIIGGGNCAHIFAGYAGSMSNVEVSMLNSLPHERKLFEKGVDQGMRIIHRNGQHDIVGRIHAVSANAEDTIPEADMVVMAVPAHVHEHYFRLIEPHVRPNLNIGVMTAQGCLDLVARDIFHNKYDYLNFFATETLPWACRLVDHGCVGEVLGAKEVVDVACHPFQMTSPACSVLTQLLSVGVDTNVAGFESHLKKDTSFAPNTARAEICKVSDDNLSALLPHFKPSPNMLSLTLMNINSVWHPCITYGRFHSWDGKTPFKSPPPFYEGVDDFTADTLNSVSNEVQLVKESLLKDRPHLDLTVVRHVSEWMLRAYGSQIVDKTSLQTCINTNKAYAGLFHPMTTVGDEGHGYVPDLTHRYWVEDLPCGMLATRGIAELANVQTPTMDKVIMWMQEMKGKEYLVHRNGDLKLAGKDIGETRAPQRYGIACLSEIIHEYEHD